MTDTLLVYCTCPDIDSAAHLARTLVEERLAACVSRIDGLISTYRWQSAIEEDAEVMLLIKTSTARYPALQARVLALHPYEVPELIATPIERGLPAYLGWLQASLGEP